MPFSLRAATFYWDANGATTGTGGTGNWETTSSLWRAGSDTGTLGIWSNIGGDNDAILGGTSGTLTLTTGISVNDITVNPSPSGTSTITGAQMLTMNGTAQPVLDVASGSTLTITSGLAGMKGFTKSSAGTLILDGAGGTNGLVGDITLNGGTLQAGSAANNGASQVLRSNAVNLAGGTTLTTVGTTIDLRVGSLSGSGSVTPATGGAINELALKDANFSGTITTTGGLTLRGGNGTTQTFSGNLTGLTGTIGINNGATLKLSGTGATAGVLGPNTGTTTTIALRGGTFLLDNSGDNTSATNGRLSDGTAFTFLGGTVSLIGNSSGTSETVGGTTFNAGANTISVTNNGGTGAQLTFTDSGSLRDQTRFTVNFVGVGGTLGATGANPRISFTGALFTNTANGMLANSSGAAVQTAGWAVANGTSWAGANGSNSIIALTDTARNSATLSSAASQELVGFAPSTTTTTLSANLGTSASVGIGALKISPTASGQTLAAGTNSIFTPALMLTGTTDFSITGSTGGMQIGSGTRYVWVTEDGTALNYGAAFASTGPINKSGAGILNLNAASSQLPAANINLLQGVLRGTTTSLGGSASSGAASTTINMRGGVLEISDGGTLTRALLTAGAAGGGAIGWDNGGSNRGDGGFSAIGGNATVSLVTTAGGSTAATPTWNDGIFASNGYALLMGSTKADSRIDFTNAIRLDDGTATNNYFAREIRVADNTSSANDVARLSGIISGSASADLLKTGAGVLELTGTNTFSGNTLIQQGTLIATNGAAIANTSAVVLSNTAGATFQLNNSETIGALSGGGTTGGNVALQTSTLTVGDQRDAAYAGVISSTSSAGGLVKQGTGTQTLSGVNTYTGSTILGGGNLQVGVSGTGTTGTGDVTVNGSGAVLSGSGTVNGNMSVITGRIMPGDSGGTIIGTLNTKSLVFTPVSSTTVAELQIASAASFDLLNITGDLTLSDFSNLLISGSGYTATIGDSFNLIDWSGNLTLGGFSTGTNLRTGSNADLNEGNLDLPDISGVGVWQISNFSGSGSLNIAVVSGVPEPSRALMLFIASGVALLRRRRLLVRSKKVTQHRMHQCE